MRIRVRYQGRVQGVGFRAATQRVAREFVVTGTVQNLSDGSVQMEAQGPAEQVRAFADRVGQVMGRNIRTQDSLEIPELPGESGFEIIH